MGNDVSTNVAMAGAKGKFDNAMKDINEQLGGHSKQGDPVDTGVTNKKDMEKRRAQREADYKMKQAARAERKAKLTEAWAKNRPTGSEGK